MDKNRIGAVVAAAGAILLVLSAFADPFGYGDEGFGWVQTLGVVIGAAALVLGLAAILWKRGEAASPRPSH
jgi:peptidoglycan/LPS O-acetylase OafA/YrhL